MGMSEFYGPARRGRVGRHHPPGARPRRDVARHGRHVRRRHNEELVGRAIADRRDEVVLATKFGIERTPTATPSGCSGDPTTCARPARPRCAVWASSTSTSTTSTARPRRPDRGDGGGDGRAGRRQGKVRHLGLSEAAPATLRRAARRAPDHRAADRVLAVDPRPRGRDPRRCCRELGIGFVAYSPLGRGFLTGADHGRRRPGRGRLPAATTPGFAARTSAATWRWSTRARPWPPSRA